MSSQLYKTIHKQAIRLQDIVTVLQKLDDKKYIDRISQLYQEIFYEEQQFTITVNQMWENVTNCFLKELEQKQEKEACQQDKYIYQEENKQRYQKNLQANQTSSQVFVSVGQNNNSMQQQIQRKENNQEQQNRKINSSRSFEKTIGDPHKMQNINHSNQSINDILKQQEKKLNNISMSMNSVKSNSLQKIDIPFSERRDSKNPLQTSFSKASRSLLDKHMSQSPGPSDYIPTNADKLVLKQSPKASFGQMKKQTFLDQKLKMEGTTPGPQYNTSQAGIYKPMKKQNF